MVNPSVHPTKHAQKGQVLLLLVLISVITMTIALSLVSRSITDVKISSQIEESGRAFSAAEAGIENALQGAPINSNVSVTITGMPASYQYSVGKIIPDTRGVVSFAPITEANESVSLWLSPHQEDGTMKLNDPKRFPVDASVLVCWGEAGSPNQPITLSLYYYHNVQQRYGMVQKEFSPQPNNDGVESASVISRSGSDDDVSFCYGPYQFMVPVKFTGPFFLNDANPDPLDRLATYSLLYLKIQPMVRTRIASVPSVPNPVTNTWFPEQGKIITSTGRTSGDVVRKIQAYQYYPGMDSLFDYSLFTQE